ncbi:MAG: hypothetical protein AB1330_01160 [Bacillota bacterium]
MLKRYCFLSGRLKDFLRRLVSSRVRPTGADTAGDTLYARREFFRRLASPSFVFRPAYPHTPPFSVDYNAMLKEAVEDLAFLRSAGEAIALQAENDFNYHVAELKRLEEKIESVGRRTQDSLLRERVLPGAYTIRENFKQGTGFSAVNFPMACIAPYGVTLGEVSRENVSPGGAVRILPGEIIEGTYFLGTYSNGFPGNTHEYVGGKFIGHADIHADYAAVIDGRPDTWFEYELVSILPEHRPSYGLHFSVPGAGRVKWDRRPYGGKLTLALEIVFDEPVIVNQFTCRFYVPPRARTPLFEGVRVSGDGITPPVSIGGYFSYTSAGEFVCAFMPRECRVVQLFFSQPHSYTTDVGCIAYKYASDPAAEVIGVPTVSGQLVGEPSIPVDLLGLEVKGTRADYPYRKNISPLGMQEILARFFTDSVAVQQTVTVVPAQRYVIGIRDVEISEARYHPVSELISPPYLFSVPPARLALRVDDYIPSGTSVEYAVSTDRVVWAPITPLGRGSGDILNIVVDPSLEEVSAVRGETMFLKRPASSFFVRVLIRGAEDNSFLTPIVRSYDVISLPEGVSWLGVG